MPDLRYRAFSSEGSAVLVREAPVDDVDCIELVEMRMLLLSSLGRDADADAEDTEEAEAAATCERAAECGVASDPCNVESSLMVRSGLRARKAAERAIRSVVFSSKVIPLELDVRELED